jgi:hypothetical protein
MMVKLRQCAAAKADTQDRQDEVCEKRNDPEQKKEGKKLITKQILSSEPDGYR